MMKIILAVVWSLTFFVTPAFAVDVGKADAILEKTLTQWIRPAYEDFHQRAETLNQTLVQLCADPDTQKLATAQSAFSQTARSWARIEWLRVGPVMSENRLERILFYPDRKSTGLKQVQRALGKKDETAIETETLKKKSVAMQGLGALEFLLFGTGHEELTISDNTYQCQYARAIGGNLYNLSIELKDGWADDHKLSQFWLKPNDANPLFRNDFEALNLLIGTLIHGLEAVKDVRIGAFLKEDDQRDRPKSALFWRSQNTLPTIKANIEGLQELLFESDFTSLLEEDSRLPQSMEFEFGQSIDTAATLGGPVADLLADDVTRQRIIYLQYTLKTIVDLLNNEFAPALGLKAGFSFGDGD